VRNRVGTFSTGLRNPHIQIALHYDESEKKPQRRKIWRNFLHAAT